MRVSKSGRIILVVMGLAVGACGPSFQEAQRQNTIEAFEKYLAEVEASDPYRQQAEVALLRLRAAEVRKTGTLEAYDRLMASSNKDLDPKLWKELMEEREKVCFNWATEKGSVEAWERYLKENPTVGRKRKAQAQARLHMVQNLDRITVGPVRQERVNLAENPEGPLDGWGFWVDVTNRGDQPIEHLYLSIGYLDDQGRVLDQKEWPAVARHLPGFMPFADGFDKPMARGETRTWEYTTGDLPEGWAQKVSITPTRIKLVGEGASDDEGDKQ